MIRLTALVAALALYPGAVAAEELVLRLDMPGDVISVTHGGAIDLPLYPEGISALEPELAPDFVLTAKLRNSDGKIIGLASEIEHFPNGKDGDWQAWWTVVIPGRGSLLGYEIERVPAEHHEAFAAAARGRDWTGRATGRVAAGPSPSGDGVIVGGTGEFAGAIGTFSEWATLASMGADGRMRGYLELRINIVSTSQQ